MFVKEEERTFSHITQEPPDVDVPQIPGPQPTTPARPHWPRTLGSPRHLHAPPSTGLPVESGRGCQVTPRKPPLGVPGYLGFTSSVFVPSPHQGQFLHPYVSGGTERTQTGREPQLGRKPTSDLLLDPTLAPPCLRFQGLGPRISGNQRPCHSIQPPK